jgi:DNA-binding XRE family transcriptional regulator
MEADLSSGERFEPVVGLSCLEEIKEPVLAPRRVRAIVGAGPRIYYVPADYLLRRVQGMLGRSFALPAGSARVWWPRLTACSDPGEHPLVLALDSESQAGMLAEFDRQFNLSRPVVRGEIRLVEDTRRLAEDELSQAREENYAIEGERDRALARAWEAGRALGAARSRESGRGEQPWSPPVGRPGAGEAGEARLRSASERMMLTRAFGEKLQHRRVAAGLSRAQLASRCRISPSTVSKIELGQSEPRLSLILILCDGLDLTPGTLIGELPIPQERKRA